jgi:uncharacterized surface protein with fasciclin (FAS1) repeats
MLSKVALLLLVVFGFSLLSVSAHGEDVALVRIAHFAADAPDADGYVDGELVFEGVATGSVSAFMEIEPGTHTLTVAPAGEAMDSAGLEMADVELEAGHRYDVALTGQAADDSLAITLIDETAALADFDMSQGAAIFMVNNIAGAPAVTFLDDDIVHSENVGYGDLVVTFVPAGSWDTARAVAADDPETVIFDFDSEEDGLGGFWEPHGVYLYGLTGSYPGAMFEDYGIVDGAPYTTAANAVELLRSFGGKNLYYDANGEVVYQFDTLLELLDEAGLTEVLEDPEAHYTLVAPTDYAFSQLPESTLDSLRENPEQLRDVLLNHVVEGEVHGDPLADVDEITTARGMTYSVSHDEENFVYLLNDEIAVSDFSYPVGNGRVFLVDSMVMLPEEE